MRKYEFCVFATDQRFCFLNRCYDSLTPYFPESEISSLQPSSVAVQSGLCRTQSATIGQVFSCRSSYCILADICKRRAAIEKPRREKYILSFRPCQIN